MKKLTLEEICDRRIPFLVETGLNRPCGKEMSFTINATKEAIRVINRALMIKAVKIDIKIINEPIGGYILIQVEILIKEGYDVRELFYTYKQVIREHLSAHSKKSFKHCKIELILSQKNEVFAHGALRKKVLWKENKKP